MDEAETEASCLNRSIASTTNLCFSASAGISLAMTFGSLVMDAPLRSYQNRKGAEIGSV